MPNFINSPNMNLPIPVVGVDPGPDYANNVNSSLTIVDSHNHSAGNGVQINPAGLNINSDLPFGNNNATLLRSTRFVSQGSPISGSLDLNCLSVSGVDLYYRDGSGNTIRITASGAVAGTPGSISGLLPPASASYNSGSGTFIFQSGANIPGNLDGASLTIRDQTLASNGITINAPVSLGANYSLNLPSALPSQQNFMTLDNSGNIAASWHPDNSTLNVVSNNLQVAPLGITNSQIANTTITNAKLAASNIVISSSCGTFSNASSTTTPVTNLSVTITTTGRAVQIGLIPDGSGSDAYYQFVFLGGGSGTTYSQLFLNRGVSVVAQTRDGGLSGATQPQYFKIPDVFLIDTPAAGTYTYSVSQATISGTNYNVFLQNWKLYAWEI